MGAVLIKDKRIIATGYNGSPTGFDNCCEIEKCIRDERQIQSGTQVSITMAVHAEINCICSAAYMGISTKGSTLYITNFPCSDCLKACIQSGIEKIFYQEEYNDAFSHELAEKSSIEIIKLNGEENG